jgi:hypothetical protein
MKVDYGVWAACALPIVVGLGLCAALVALAAFAVFAWRGRFVFSAEEKSQLAAWRKAIALRRVRTTRNAT